jgi:hypothetical protein
MLPAIRSAGCLYDIPKFDITVPDIKDFAKELKGFHSQFADCFSREEPRENITWQANSVTRLSGNRLSQ